MKKIIIAILILVIIGLAAYFYLLRPVEAPTEDISEASQSEQLDAEEGEMQYRVTQDSTNVEFRINEVLRGEPFTAVGTTNQVAADFVIDKDNSEQIVTLGTVKVDARTFKTDSENRDAAIARFILASETEGNEYITFEPKTYSGIPETITEGQPFTFTVSGDMTISGVTHPETLTITMTQTPERLIGTVDVAVKRSDYNLKIPSVDFVASVEDNLTVKTTFVADRVE